MPKITKTVESTVATGMVCDVCSKRDENHFNDFSLGHTFGFDSSADSYHVEAAVCDDCLIDIILEKISGAVFTNEHGRKISRKAFRELVLKNRKLTRGGRRDDDKISHTE